MLAHGPQNALIGHNHDSDYAPVDHNHDGDYAPMGHNHDGDYAPLGHDHDSDYVNEGQANSITSGMITDGEVSGADITDGSIDFGATTLNVDATGRVVGVGTAGQAADLEVWGDILLHGSFQVAQRP